MLCYNNFDLKYGLNFDQIFPNHWRMRISVVRITKEGVVSLKAITEWFL
jgi:hypothetical protein